MRPKMSNAHNSMLNWTHLHHLTNASNNMHTILKYLEQDKFYSVLNFILKILRISINFILLNHA